MWLTYSLSCQGGSRLRIQPAMPGSRVLAAVRGHTASTVGKQREKCCCSAVSSAFLLVHFRTPFHRLEIVPPHIQSGSSLPSQALCKHHRRCGQRRPENNEQNSNLSSSVRGGGLLCNGTQSHVSGKRGWRWMHQGGAEAAL